MSTKFIKIMSVTTIAGLLLASFISLTETVPQSQGNVSDDFLDEDMESCYVVSNSAYADGGTAYASSAVGIWNCFWNPAEDRWQYTFKIGGMGSSTGLSGIRSAAIEIEAPVSTENNIIIDEILHSSYIWSTPRSNSGSSDTAKVSNLVISVLISAIGGPAAGITWSLASAVISELGSGLDELNYRDNYRWYLWQWSPDIDQTCQQVVINAKLKSDKTESFTAEYFLFGPTYELLSPGKMKLTMTSPKFDGPELSLMSEEERTNIGISTVHRDQLQSVANSYNLSRDVVDHLLESQDEEFYFTSSDVKCDNVASSGPNTTTAYDDNDMASDIKTDVLTKTPEMECIYRVERNIDPTNI